MLVVDNSSANDGQLYVELWTSLASVLRSYTALHGLVGKKQANVEQDQHRILVSCGTDWLKLERDGASIQWQRADGRDGTLEFTENGRLRSVLKFDEEQNEEEMDMAAEAWARELMR